VLALQPNAKTLEGRQHPDRNAQFEYLNARVESFLEQGLPVISVDTEKKKLVGSYKNNGQEWHRKENRKRPWCMIPRTRNQARQSPISLW
jgi:elongation factor P hydroxylase